MRLRFTIRDLLWLTPDRDVELNDCLDVIYWRDLIGPD